MKRASSLFYRLALFVPCHRKPSRCFHLHQKPMPICARCLGILCGIACFPILFLFTPMPIWLAFLMQIPMLTDGFSQLYRWRTSNNPLRFTTGLISGLGLSIFIVSGTHILFQIGTQGGI